MLKTLDSVAFVGISWCSCRMLLLYLLRARRIDPQAENTYTKWHLYHFSCNHVHGLNSVSDTPVFLRRCNKIDWFPWKSYHWPILLPTTKLREGNVSTPVCHSVCRRMGSLSRGRFCLVGYLSREVSVQGDHPYSNVSAVHILLECILVL